MIAKEFCMSEGVGISDKRLPSFDKALLDAGVGNYNLVRLSSILPSGCKEVSVSDLPYHLPEGSLLPTAYSTISCDKLGAKIASTIALGIPKDKSHVCVIMEYSAEGVSQADAISVVSDMVEEAFAERGWELEAIRVAASAATVEIAGAQYTTFACLSEW